MFFKRKKTVKLYYMPGACSLAVHIALRKAGIVPQLVRYDTSTGKTDDGRTFRDVNPKGYVPVLIADDGEARTEVVALLLGLDADHPSAKLLPKSGAPRRRALEWLAYITTELHKNYAPMFSQATSPDYKNVVRERVEARLAYVADALQRSGPYLLGDEPTSVDDYLLVMLLWAQPTQVDLSRWPSLVECRDRLLQTAPIQSAMRAEGLIS
jgi:glutathione S-transferase